MRSRMEFFAEGKKEEKKIVAGCRDGSRLRESGASLFSGGWHTCKHLQLSGIWARTYRHLPGLCHAGRIEREEGCGSTRREILS